MKFLSPLLLILFGCFTVLADDPSKILEGKSTDGRMELKDLNKSYFPFTPPKTKEEWEQRKAFVKLQVQVAEGLYPLPERTPLQPVIYGKIDRPDYTVEKVYFASLPGHYVTGNLYRPKNSEAKHPAVLCPHGHWANARLMDVGEKVAAQQIAIKAEKYPENARHFLQTKCAQLARMGCVVFMFDMVGYTESTAITHREGFKDAQAELWLQSFMGLQSWNGIRCVDFLESLPDVDAKRIGVTGASGGATQTLVLGAIDDRIHAVFPAVMVSTGMQGGCVCENCSLLRVNTGNVELAGLFAPKPIAMSGADDWTIQIETKGYPELKQLYAMYGAEDKVLAKAWPEFKHNYNLPARELMYTWFNKHLLGKDEKVTEGKIDPISAADLTVFNADHPRPKDETDAAGVRKWFTEQSEKQLMTMKPAEVLSALKVLINDDLPTAKQLRIVKPLPERKLKDGTLVHGIVIGRQGETDAIPCLGLVPPGFAGTVAIWLHPKGKASLFDAKGEPTAEVQALLDKKIGVMSLDTFQTGELATEKKFPVDQVYAGFTYGYNRSVLANRVHDTLTIIGFAKNRIKPKKIDLIGWGSMGTVAILTKAVAGDAIERTAAELNHFSFDKITSTSDENLLPGALKYGGLEGFLKLCDPKTTRAFQNPKATEIIEWLTKQ